MDLLVADCSKINKKIGWKAKIKIDKLIERMVLNDFNLLKKEA